MRNRDGRKSRESLAIQGLVRLNANREKQAVLPMLCAGRASEREKHGKANSRPRMVLLPRLQQENVYGQGRRDLSRDNACLQAMRQHSRGHY